MKKPILLIFICLFCAHCATSPPKEKNLSLLPQIIFIPGYYGSYLKRAGDGKRIWFTATEALWGDQTLALDEQGLNIPGATPLRVDGIFRSVDFIPGIISKDGYQKIIGSLHEKLDGQAQVVPFSYDWRKDLTLASKNLARLVAHLYSKGAPKVALVAHSMGGLIASYYLLYGDQSLNNPRLNLSGAKRTHAVVMAATPFKGTMSVFRNMHFGVKFGYNTKALEAHAVASFPSSYYILPSYPGALLSVDVQDRSSWMFDGDRWVNFNWGLLSNMNELDETTRVNREGFTKKMLLLGRTFYNKVHHYRSEMKSRVPFLYLYSDQILTINQAVWHDKDKVLLFPGKNLKDKLKGFKEKLLLLKGDGTVTYESAQPPKPFAATFPSLEIRKRKQGHLDLLKEEENIDEIIRFLRKALQLEPPSS